MELKNGACSLMGNSLKKDAHACSSRVGYGFAPVEGSEGWDSCGPTVARSASRTRPRCVQIEMPTVSAECAWSMPRNWYSAVS